MRLRQQGIHELFLHTMGIVAIFIIARHLIYRPSCCSCRLAGHLCSAIAKQNLKQRPGIIRKSTDVCLALIELEQAETVLVGSACMAKIASHWDGTGLMVPSGSRKSLFAMWHAGAPYNCI